MRKGVLVLVAAVFVLPTFASQLGHPLDCSDWIIALPGVNCSVSTARGNLAEGSPFLDKGANLALDPAGWRYVLRPHIPVTSGCPVCDLGSIDIVRFNGRSKNSWHPSPTEPLQVTGETTSEPEMRPAP